MNEIERLCALLTRISAEEAWHGRGLAGLLADVSAKEASAPLPSGSHTIWQVVRHVIAWREIARGLIDGGARAQASAEENWPVIADTSDAAWKATLGELAESGRRLEESIARFPENRLDEPVSAYDASGAKGITYYQLLHGVIQHDVYHAGQIAILRNALRQKSSTADST